MARVGDHDLTVAEVIRHLRQFPRERRRAFRNRKERQRVLDKLIDDELFATEARRRGLDDDPVVQRAIAELLAAAMLAQADVDLPAPDSFSADEVKAYYQAKKKERYTLPERRSVAAIAFATRHAAAKVHRMLGKQPTDIAWRKAVGKHGGQDDGMLGHVGPPGDDSGVDPRVAEPLRTAVFTVTTVGEVVGEVVAHGSKFYVVRLNGRTAGQVKSFHSVSSSIRKELVRNERTRRQEALVAALAKELGLSIDEAALDAVPLPEGYDAYVPYWQKKK